MNYIYITTLLKKRFTETLYYKPMLSSSARRLQLTKERQHLNVRKKVRWCRAIPFRHFPKENVIFKIARISIPMTRVFGKYPRVRQICPQMETLVFFETWEINSNHCGTFISVSIPPLCNADAYGHHLRHYKRNQHMHHHCGC